MLSVAHGLYKGIGSVGDYGKKYAEYEQKSQDVINNIRLIREQTMDENSLFAEALLIQSLDEIEKEKNGMSSSVAVDLTKTSVKMCVGPVGDVVAEVGAATANGYLKGEEKSGAIVANALEHAAEKEINKQVTVAAMSTAASVATQILGDTTAALVVANSPWIAVAGLAAGGVAIATNAKVRQSFWEGLKNTTKGAVALVSEGKSKAFSSESINEVIVKNYGAWQSKKIAVLDLEGEKEKETAKQKQTADRVDSLKDEIAADQKNFDSLRAKSRFSRFVFRVNKNKGFYALLTCFLNAVWSCFRKEKSAQDAARSSIETKTVSMGSANEELKAIQKKIDVLAQKILVENQELEPLEEAYLERLKA